MATALGDLHPLPTLEPFNFLLCLVPAPASFHPTAWLSQGPF